jgi:DNA-binding NarL/FixJ family response regulator
MTPNKLLNLIILDDHPMIIDGVRLLLTNAPGYSLIGSAASVRELISLLTPDMDILILDLNIRGENILKHIGDIRSRHPRIKILVFSSYNTPSLVRRAFEEGVQGYLLKDTTRDELLFALETIRRGKTFIGNNVSLPKSGLNLPPQRREVADDFEKTSQLSERELEVLRLMAQGLESQEIAARLYISLHTVQSHRKNILHKLDLHSAAEGSQHVELLQVTWVVPPCSKPATCKNSNPTCCRASSITGFGRWAETGC